MITLNFEEQGMSFPVNYKFLKSIAEHLPDDTNYENLASALLALNIPSINESIATSFYDNLSASQKDMLWDCGDQMTREAILDHADTFCRNLTEERVRQLMTENDKKTLIYIAGNSEYLFPSEDQTSLLSESAARELLLFLKNHQDPKIRGALACNYFTPDEFRMSFTEFMEANLDNYAQQAVASITEEDVEKLKKENSRKIAQIVASSLKFAGKTQKIRKALAEWLLHYPDPEIRIDLAENDDAPSDVLRRLLEDAEPDVVQAARNTLAKREENVLDAE